MGSGRTGKERSCSFLPITGRLSWWLTYLFPGTWDLCCWFRTVEGNVEEKDHVTKGNSGSKLTLPPALALTDTGQINPSGIAVSDSLRGGWGSLPFLERSQHSKSQLLCTFCGDLRPDGKGIVDSGQGEVSLCIWGGSARDQEELSNKDGAKISKDISLFSKLSPVSFSGRCRCRECEMAFLWSRGQQFHTPAQQCPFLAGEHKMTPSASPQTTSGKRQQSRTR